MTWAEFFSNPAWVLFILPPCIILGFVVRWHDEEGK